MTLISRIRRLQAPGVLCDFTWPGDLPNFGRFNLIYGWNGSGKTTLSGLLRCLELRAGPPGVAAKITIGTRDVSGEEFPEAALPIRVFNRDFVRENVFPGGGKDVAPILVLGKENIDKQKELDALKTSLGTLTATLESTKEKKDAADRAFERHSISKAALIKEALRITGGAYNNYDKTSYRRRAGMMVAADDSAAHRLSQTAREAALTRHRATAKPKLGLLTCQMPDVEEAVRSVRTLLARTVVASTIETLKDDAALSAWVHQGLDLHHAKSSTTCLFCEGPLPDSRLAALDAHFSSAYRDLVRAIDTQRDELESAIAATESLSPPRSSDLFDDFVPALERAETSLKSALGVAKTALTKLAMAVREKKAKPFDAITLEFEVPALDGEAVARVNAVIEQHNAACDQLGSRAKDARERLEADSVAETIQEFVDLQDAAKAAAETVTKTTEEVGQLREKIASGEREIVEHRTCAEQLNADLRNYLGHDELQLEIKDTGYAISRRGTLATGLSEGETTAIALLYFLKSLEDRRFNVKRGVVVLDDPVSSLDANALFLAFGFIRDKTEGAGQLFIFTHNFTFFRQVRNWFQHMKGQRRAEMHNRPARFYMLECCCESGVRTARLRWLDPLLEEFESEYHYLFARLYREMQDERERSLGEYYVYPNMARRLLETFLAFRQPDIQGELEKKIERIDFDGAKKCRVLRFLHTHSHGDTIGEPEHDLSTLAETRAVLGDLFDLIKSEDEAHFAAMVSLVSAMPEEADKNVVEPATVSQP